MKPERIAELEKDAERYRWIRWHVEPANPGLWAHFVGDWKTNGIDAAIDERIKYEAARIQS